MEKHYYSHEPPVLERIQGCRFHCPVIPESHLQYPGSAWLLNRGQTLSNIPKCYQVPPLCIFLLPVLVITSGDAYLVPNISRTQQQLRYLKTIARVSFAAPLTQRVTLLTFMANHRLQTPQNPGHRSLGFSQGISHFVNSILQMGHQEMGAPFQVAV